MVRVALQRDYTNDEKAAIKHRLLAMGARDVRWMELKQKEVAETESESDKSGHSAPELHQDLFNAWIEKDTKGLHGLDQKVLARCNEEVTHEGDELYAVEATEM